MSVRELQDTLHKVAEDADAFKDLLGKFLAQNEEDLSDAMRALDGNTTGTDGAVRASLNSAKSALESARASMADAAEAARDYASRI